MENRLKPDSGIDRVEDINIYMLKFQVVNKYLIPCTALSGIPQNIKNPTNFY